MSLFIIHKNGNITTVFIKESCKKDSFKPVSQICLDNVAERKKFLLLSFLSLPFFFFPKQTKISPINVPISEGKELFMHTLVLVVRPIRKSWNDWYLKCYHLRWILPSRTDLQQLHFFLLSLSFLFFFLFFLHTKTKCKPRRILLATFFFLFSAFLFAFLPLLIMQLQSAHTLHSSLPTPVSSSVKIEKHLSIWAAYQFAKVHFS